jgi:hypothetical protein
MKLGGGRGIVDKNKSRIGVEKSRKKRSVKYLAISYKVVVTFIGMCKKEGV